MGGSYVIILLFEIFWQGSCWQNGTIGLCDKLNQKKSNLSKEMVNLRNQIY